MIPSHKLMMPSPAQQQGKICVCILAVTGPESVLASSCPATVVGLMKWQLQRYDPVHPPPLHPWPLHPRVVMEKKGQFSIDLCLPGVGSKTQYGVQLL